jgi:hypothetical protein
VKKERKNIMIENEKWELLKMIAGTTKDKSISKVISFAVDKYIENEFNNNLAFKLKMIAMGKYVSSDEEKEILKELKIIIKNEDVE